MIAAPVPSTTVASASNSVDGVMVSIPQGRLAQIVERQLHVQALGGGNTTRALPGGGHRRGRQAKVVRDLTQAFDQDR